MQLTSINIGQKRSQLIGTDTEITGIYKIPIEGPAQVMELGIKGDFIASKQHHGGPDQAVYVYGGADYAWWSGELEKDIGPGTFGDNLTISELESSQFNIGDYLHFSEVTLQVTAPRIPCVTFAAHMEDPQFVKRFRRAEHPGLYCRVIHEGNVEAGNNVIIEKYRGESIPVMDLFRDYYRRNKKEETLRQFLKAPIAIRARQDVESDLQKILMQR